MVQSKPFSCVGWAPNYLPAEPSGKEAGGTSPEAGVAVEDSDAIGTDISDHRYSGSR